MGNHHAHLHALQIAEEKAKVPETCSARWMAVAGGFGFACCGWCGGLGPVATAIPRNPMGHLVVAALNEFARCASGLATRNASAR